MDSIGREGEDPENMFNPFRRRPYAFFERTPSGRERIVLGRRHSHHGYREPDVSPEDADRGWDQDRRLLAENQALHEDNQRLLRDNQALTRQLNAARHEVNAVRHERDYLVQQNQRIDDSERVIRDLERRLTRERRRIREERAEREALDAERIEQARVAEEEIRRLREEDRRWRATVMQLTREVEGWVRVSRDKETRIRTLEAFLRRQGFAGVR
jgi:hypothetical protein